MGDLLVEFSERPGVDCAPEVLTLTERNGFVRQADRFKKRLATEDTSKYKIVRRNDIAFNPYLLWAGAVAQNTIVDKGIISPLYPTFRVREGNDPGYVARLLLSEALVALYDTIAFGSIPRRRRSTTEDFLKLKIPTQPPMEEQQRIAAVLDLADLTRSKGHSILAELDQLTESLFYRFFGEPTTWPTRFTMGTIEDMALSIDYGTSAKAGPEGAWPILRMGNVTADGRLDLSDLKYLDLAAEDVPKYTVRRNDMLFNRTNSVERVGKTAVVHTDQHLALAGYLIRVRFRAEHRAEFVSAYLNSMHGRALRRTLAKAAVNQANISASDLRKISIAMPPTDLQDEFAHALSKIRLRRQKAEETALLFDELFASLNARAFRGELR